MAVDLGGDAERTVLTPAAVAQRYTPPARDSATSVGGSLPTAGELNAFAAWLGPPSWWTPPRILAVLALAVVVFFNPIATVLGGIGHYLARKRGESTRLPKVAWVLSLVIVAFGLALNGCARSVFTMDGLY